MQLFVSDLIAQCKRYELDAELVLVEWNPPSNRARLIEALHWPEDSGCCAVRVIEVSPEIHKRFKYSDRLPLFQMIAKNAGIRRARGQFVLATNVDILFSEELARNMASGGLRKKRMYRVDRYDVFPNVPEDAPNQVQLEYCRRNVIRINTCEGTQNLRTGYNHVIFGPLTWGGGCMRRCRIGTWSR